SFMHSSVRENTPARGKLMIKRVPPSAGNSTSVFPMPPYYGLPYISGHEAILYHYRQRCPGRKAKSQGRTEHHDRRMIGARVCRRCCCAVVHQDDLDRLLEALAKLVGHKPLQIIREQPQAAVTASIKRLPIFKVAGEAHANAFSLF